MHYPNYIAAKTYGRRGFTVIELEDGTFQFMTYIVGHKPSVRRELVDDLETAQVKGHAYLTPIERWVDVTSECKYEQVELYGLNNFVVVITHKGKRVNPLPGGDYHLEDGKIFNKKKYYDS